MALRLECARSPPGTHATAAAQDDARFGREAMLGALERLDSETQRPREWRLRRLIDPAQVDHDVGASDFRGGDESEAECGAGACSGEGEAAEVQRTEVDMNQAAEDRRLPAEENR